jgi:hypothetical protein
MQVLLECCHIQMESSQWENWNNLFCCNVSFPTDPHRRSRVTGQDMKLTYLYLWYPLFQGTYEVQNEIETKRNETKSTKTKRSETKSTKWKRNKTKPTKAKRNQRKQNEIDWYEENGRKKIKDKTK